MFIRSNYKKASRMRKFTSLASCSRTRTSWTVEPLEDRRLLAVNAFGNDSALYDTAEMLQERPSIAMNSDGEYAVAWQEGSNVSTGMDVVVQRYNADGSELGSLITLADTSLDEQHPSIDIGSNSLVAVWEQVDSADSKTVEGKIIKWDSSGDVTDTLSFTVASSIGGSAFVPLFPSVATNDSGEFAVGWYEVVQKVSIIPVDTDVRVQWFHEETSGSSPQVLSVGSVVTVNNSPDADWRNNFSSPNGANQVGAEIAMDRDGNFVVVWNGPGTDADSNIYARRFTAGSAAASAAPVADGEQFRVNTTDLGSQTFAGVDMTSDGTMVIAWHEFESAEPVSPESNIRARVILPSDVPVGDGAGNITFTNEEFLVNVSGNEVGEIVSPSVKFSADTDTNQQFAITYSSTFPSQSTTDIALALYQLEDDADGVDVIHEEFRASSTLGGDLLFPVAAVGAEGDIVLVWTDRDAGSSEAELKFRQFANTRVVEAATISEGESLVLNAVPRFQETATVVPALTYNWDVDGDGLFDDGTGSILTLDWSTLNMKGIEDNQDITVAVQVAGPLFTNQSSQRTVSIVNAAPTASISGQATAVRGEIVTFTLTATDASPTDQSADFTFAVDWDDDGTVDETFVGPSGMTVEHVFTSDAEVDISLVATDKDGAQSAEVLTEIDVNIWETRVNGSVTDLVYGGTAGVDDVSFSPLSATSISVSEVTVDSVLVNNTFTVNGVDGNIIAYGQGGNDSFSGSSLTAHGVAFYGGDGADTLVGGSGDDTLSGGLGNDSLTGGTGTDRVLEQADVDFFLFDTSLSGVGSDTLSSIEEAELIGGDSDNVFSAFDFTGDATLQGGLGDDDLRGASGNNYILGGAGDDTLSGSSGNDSLVGGSGNDGLGSLAGNDTLVGNEGDDTLTGGEGNDSLVGGTGNDWYVFVRLGTQDLGSDTLDEQTLANDEFDVLEFSVFGAAITVDLSGDDTVAAVSHADFTLTLVDKQGIEVIAGTEFADSITGNDRDNYLAGGEGNDTLAGGGGNDFYLFGRSGLEDLGSNTVVESTSSNDDMDFLDFSGFGAGVTVDLSADTLPAVSQTDLVVTLTNELGIEGVIGSALGDTITGNSRDNLITGSAGADSIAGGLGNDSLNGAGGDDTLDGGSGTDFVVEEADVNFVLSDSALTGVGSDTLTSIEEAELAGGDSANTLSALGFSGNATLLGGAGNDTISGGTGDDALIGGSGNDTYAFDRVGSEDLGNDTITEETATNDSRDTLDFSQFGATIDVDLSNAAAQDVHTSLNLTLGSNVALEDVGGSAFGDTIVGNSRENDLQGGAGADNITGRSGDDTLQGEAGNDTLLGVGGDDSLQGGDGADSLNGGAGNDTLEGGIGDDSLRGDSGDDSFVFAQSSSEDLGSDTLTESTAFNDAMDVLDFSGFGQAVTVDISSATSVSIANELTLTLKDQEENDNALGIEGVIGSSFGDTVTGNNRDNFLVGGGDADDIDGGAGNDTLQGEAGNDSLDGNTGTDRVLEEGDVNFVLNDTLLTGVGSDALTSIEEAELVGGDSANSISASSFTGDAILDGGLGNDTVTGGSGDDTLTGGLGNDSLSGGTGTDRVLEEGDVNFVLNDTLLTGVGSDALTSIEEAELIGGDSDNGFSAFGFTGDATLQGGLGDDTLRGGSGNDYILGGAGDDTLSGRSGNDSLVGGSGNDWLGGDAGNDTLIGNEGDDILVGGEGNDSLVGGTGNDLYAFLRLGTEDLGSDTLDEQTVANDEFDVLEFSVFGAAITVDLSGDDTVAAVSHADLTLTLVDKQGIEAVAGSAFADSITGNDRVNFINGNAGNDTVHGGDGDDFLVGGVGDDSITGGEGNDFLEGETGDDTLIGGAGKDILNGGLGADSLSGEAGDDILIAGFIDFGEDTLETLSDIFEEWNSGNSYQDRVDNILAGSPDPSPIPTSSQLDPGSTVFDDDDDDTLVGGSDDDWFLYDDGEDTTDQENSEVETDIGP